MPIIIDSKNEDKIRSWFETRGGVLLWRNEEIASSYPPELFTPALDESGNAYQSPGWRYPIATPVAASDVLFEDLVVLDSWPCRIKRYYWGLGLAESSEVKAKRAVAKHGDRAEYRWVYDDRNHKTIVQIVRPSTRPMLANQAE